MDPLATLGILPGSSLEETKTAYRKLCLLYHPDKNPDEGAAERFNEIYLAFKSILENPSLLDPIKISSFSTGFIQVKVPVSIKSIYLNEDVAFSVSRLVFCKRCEGSGFLGGLEDVCRHCDGKGSVDSAILKILGENSSCPVCKGSGSLSNKCCTDCGGNKRVPEQVNLRIKVSPAEAEKGGILLRNRGNEHSKGMFGDIKVILKVKIDNTVHMANGNFITHAKISPVDRILCSSKQVDIYGKLLTFSVMQEYDYCTIEDVRPGIPQRKLTVKFAEFFPIVTPQTRSLYEKILEIERSMFFEEKKAPQE